MSEPLAFNFYFEGFEMNDNLNKLTGIPNPLGVLQIN